MGSGTLSLCFLTPTVIIDAPSGIVGVVGGCLEKPGLVLAFAILYVVHLVAFVISGIVGIVLQPAGAVSILLTLGMTVTKAFFFFVF